MATLLNIVATSTTLSDPSKSTIVVTGYQMDENGSWVESRGGGYTMELLFKQVSIPNHQGSYFIFPMMMAVSNQGTGKALT